MRSNFRDSKYQHNKLSFFRFIYCFLAGSVEKKHTCRSQTIYELSLINFNSYALSGQFDDRVAVLIG